MSKNLFVLTFPVIIDVNTLYKSWNLIIFDQVDKPHFVKNNSEMSHIVKNAAEAFVTAAIKPFCLKLVTQSEKVESYSN